MMLNKALRKAPTFTTGGLLMYMIMSEIMNIHNDFSTSTKQKLNGHFRYGGWVVDPRGEELTCIVEEHSNKSSSALQINLTMVMFHLKTFTAVASARFMLIVLLTLAIICILSVHPLNRLSPPLSTTFSQRKSSSSMANYILHQLLCDHESVPSFVGGTAFQAILGATDYHR